MFALAALAATTAFAQSSVTMYGVIDVAYGSHTTSAAGVTTQKSAGVMDGSLAGSRFGFRGTEDLGGGLKADFVLEHGVSPTSPQGYNYRVGSSGHQITNNSTYNLGNNRQSFIALSGGFGAVNAGYLYTNAYNLAGTMSGMGGELQGTSTHLGGLVAGSRFTGIKYVAPAMGAVKIQAEMGSAAGQRATQEATSNQADGYKTNNQAVTSVSAVYSAGPLMAGVVYTQNKKEYVANTAPVTNIFGSSVAAGTAVNDTAKATQIVATYNLGVARIGFTNINATTLNVDTKANQVAVNVPMGATTLLAVMGTTKTGTTVDMSSSAVGFKHSLSKRSTVYGYYGSDKNDVGTTKDTKFVVGVGHSF